MAVARCGFPAIGMADVQCLLHIWENCGILATDHGIGAWQAWSNEIIRTPTQTRRTWIAYGNLVSTFTIHSPVAGFIHLQLDLYNIIAMVFCPSDLACLFSGKQKEQT
jgi:hypothetical protein